MLPEASYRQGRLPGAQLFPHTEVEARATAQLPDKAAPVVVYCASGACPNSHTAAALLTELGYADVAVYAGGKADWLRSGRSLEPGS